MPRKPRITKKARAPLSEIELAYLTDGELEGVGGYILSCYRRGSCGMVGMLEPHEVWKKNRTEYLRAFIKAHPGTRPTPWWQFDAPKEPVPGWDESHFDTPQRRRLGGTGTPSHELLAVWGGFTKGIPNSWEEIDPADPPIFESEASYLDRLGLLTDAEKKWLASHPEAMEPEVIFKNNGEERKE